MVTKKPQSESSGHHLAILAEAFGLQTQYRDALGRVRTPSRECLLQALFALGASVNGKGDLEEALRQREAELWGRLVAPVVVAWEGVLPALTLRLPSARAEETVRFHLVLEDGSTFEAGMAVGDVLATDSARVEGRDLVVHRVPPGRIRRALCWESERLPWGRHRLLVEAGGVTGEATVLAAPRRCWDEGAGERSGTAQRSAQQGLGSAQRGAAGATGRGGGASAAGHSSTIGAALAALDGARWGVFAPVYALRSGRDWGAGDLAELRMLRRWTEEVGGSVVATLPLLASSSEEDADPSPYRPSSRLLWNEFFLAPEETEEWRLRGRVTGEWETEQWLRRREALRTREEVDYEAVMALKRPVLEELARRFFEEADGGRKREFADYLEAAPHAREYAAFRAVGRDREEERYHLYCQWQMDRQLAALAGGDGPGLLFDLPLGVHPAGFDAHRWPGLFASGMSTGAPPDAFFTLGQDWSTPPLHPEADRLTGYAYLSACLRNLMRHSATVRIDHIMAFHRLFWIPEGADPAEGVYVTYPSEELYALLCLESNRHRTAVVGEDLGTVPAGVRASMRRHGVASTSVLLGSLRPRARTLDVDVPTGAVVTLETHDMYPLAGFLHGDDIGSRVETGQLDGLGAARAAEARRRLVVSLARQSGAPEGDVDAAAPHILAGCLASLARSAARLVLVNLEDLLLERRPQNVPGTGAERGNWRRKLAVALEELFSYTRASR